MSHRHFSRREFIHRGLVFAAGSPLAMHVAQGRLLAAEPAAAAPRRADAKVAITACRGYGAEVKPALAKCFDLLGGVGSLVKNKTVTIKINLTGTNFTPYLGRPVGETFMTHYDTALALASLLLAEGAKRVRFVESTQSRANLTTSLNYADWDVKSLENLGKVEFENTRNLGSGKNYAHLPVPGGGHAFSSLDLNQSYSDTDVMVSLAKLKNHITAGVTLTMKNMFGITPNSLYGGAAGSEDALEGRQPLHDPRGFEKIKIPGLKSSVTSVDSTWRVPRMVADICAARPIHLAIIDGVYSMEGGELPSRNPAQGASNPLHPGVLIAGLNPVCTDAVGTAVMGYADPRALRGTKPFNLCDNHLLLAEQSGVGCADLAQIDVRGMTIEKARYPYS